MLRPVLRRELTWQPRLGRSLPLCTLREAPRQDVGARQCRQVFPVWPEKKWAEVGLGIGEKIRGGTEWIPWEEGGEFCSQPGAPAPRSDFNPGYVLCGLGEGRESKGAHAGRRACTELAQGGLLRPLEQGP